MLRDVAWREAMDSWKEEARSHSKLAEVQKLIEKGYEARCVEVKCKWRRRVLVQLRGGTAALEVETSRWRGVSREGRVCRNCRSEEVENVEHWLLRCTGMAEEREKLIRTMREKVEWQSMEDDERVAAVLSYACRDDGVGRGVEMWQTVTATGQKKRSLISQTAAHREERLAIERLQHIPFFITSSYYTYTLPYTSFSLLYIFTLSPYPFFVITHLSNSYIAA